MRVLFDNGTPRGIAAALSDHTVEEARARGWDTLKNGELLDAAEAARFDVFVTTDRNIRHQQSLTHRKIAVVVLEKARWKLIKRGSPTLPRPWPLPSPVVCPRWTFRIYDAEGGLELARTPSAITTTFFLRAVERLAQLGFNARS